MTDYDVSGTDLRACPDCGTSEGHHTAACRGWTEEQDAKIAQLREADPEPWYPSVEAATRDLIPVMPCPVCHAEGFCLDTCPQHAADWAEHFPEEDDEIYG